MSYNQFFFSIGFCFLSTYHQHESWQLCIFRYVWPLWCSCCAAEQKKRKEWKSYGRRLAVLPLVHSDSPSFLIFQVLIAISLCIHSFLPLSALLRERGEGCQRVRCVWVLPMLHCNNKTLARTARARVAPRRKVTSARRAARHATLCFTPYKSADFATPRGNRKDDERRYGSRRIKQNRLGKGRYGTAFYVLCYRRRASLKVESDICDRSSWFVSNDPLRSALSRWNAMDVFARLFRHGHSDRSLKNAGSKRCSSAKRRPIKYPHAYFLAILKPTNRPIIRIPSGNLWFSNLLPFVWMPTHHI